MVVRGATSQDGGGEQGAEASERRAFFPVKASRNFGVTVLSGNDRFRKLLFLLRTRSYEDELRPLQTFHGSLFSVASASTSNSGLLFAGIRRNLYLSNLKILGHWAIEVITTHDDSATSRHAESRTLTEMAMTKE
jgi:hypothetical protein